MSLHLVFTRAGYVSCLQRKLPDDPVILIADGVYVSPSTALGLTHALERDAKIRGVNLEKNKVNPIDYDAIVSLTEKHTPIVSWSE
jgi:sulfur relay protein TusB/DsrH